MQGLGGALFEAIEFADGHLRNGTMAQYRVPRFKDVPAIDVDPARSPRHLPSAGAGESSMIVRRAGDRLAVRAFGKVDTALPIRLLLTGAL